MEAFETLCRDYALLPASGVVLCAVSGGADSMCLLHLLNQHSKRQGFSVAAAHFDHHIRLNSGEDAAFAANWCAQSGIPFYLGGVDVPAEAHRTGEGLEECARRLRYAFLYETAQAVGAQRIATAHNADDNAETLLLHLLRGTGLNGLGGIAPVWGKLIRPLLTTERREIEAYNAANGVPFVEDATNSDTTYTRNFIRHQLMPLFRQRNPQFIAAAGRTARALRQDGAYLDKLAAEQLANTDGTSCPVTLLANLPEALANRVLQQLAAAHCETLVLTEAQRRQALRLCQSSGSSGSVQLPEGMQLRREFDRLLLEPQPMQCQLENELTLALPGTCVFRGWLLQAERAVCPQGHTFNRGNSFYLISGNSVLTVRPRQIGDEITLPGRRRKTLKKLMVDDKVSRPLRDTLPVLTDGTRLAAVGGFGCDASALPREGEPCWHITLCSNPLSCSDGSGGTENK